MSGRGPGPGLGFGCWLDPSRVRMISSEWSAIEAGFVDDPAAAVEHADELVARTTALVADAMGQRRRSLRASDRAATDGSTVPTEELRLALSDYHALLDRLLAS